MQKAIFLEDILEKGEDPGAAAKRVAEVEKAKKAQEAAAAKSQREREERERAALAQAEAEVKKAGSNSAKLKHTFLIPLSKAKSVHRKEVSSSITEGSNTDTRKDNTHRSTTPTEFKDKTTELRTKSARSRFASFRRLGSLSRPSKDANGHSFFGPASFFESTCSFHTPVVHIAFHFRH